MGQTSNLASLEIQSLASKKQIQDYETQKEVWMSLLKGLPTVIVVTIVAVVTSLIYGGNSGSRIALTGSFMVFVCIAALWLFALIITTKADKRLVELREKSESLKRKEDKLRTEAKEMFLKYKNTMMTNQAITPSYGMLDTDSSTMNPGQIIDWRTLLTKDRQLDMEHLNPDLVQKMDQLHDISEEFESKFNEYAVTVRMELLDLSFVGIEDYNQKDVRRMLVYGTYSYIVGSFPKIPEEFIIHFLLRLVPQLEWSLSRLPNRPVIEARIQKLTESDALKELAQEAHNVHESVVELYNRMMVELRYEYSAET
jgi:hypothetical protein